MTSQEWLQIRRLHEEGLGIRAIARYLKTHRRRVRKALKSEKPPKNAGRPRGSLIDPFRGWLLAKLQQFPEISAARLFSMLQEQQYKGGYSLVKKAVADLRPRTKVVYQTLHFQPGECAQVDWGVWTITDIENTRRRLSFFAMILAHSRMLYAEFFLGESIEFWLTAHRKAFEYFGGVPQYVMVDNCKTAVLKPRRNGSEPTLNPEYLAFARDYGFEVHPCTPYRPNEKGRVEKVISYIRTGFLAGRQPTLPEVLNPALWNWLENTANVRTHRTTRERPCDRFQKNEKSALKPLPRIPHPCSAILSVVGNSCCRVNVETNRYSIPPEFASSRLLLHRYVDRVILLSPDGQQIANHLRCFARNTEILDPAHQEALKKVTNRARENQQISTFLTLGSAAQNYLNFLKDKRPDYRCHIRKINTQIEIFGREAVSRALEDAHEHQAYAADYVFNILQARKRSGCIPASPLSLVRNTDLLKIQLPEPNLNVYNKENKS